MIYYLLLAAVIYVTTIIAWPILVYFVIRAFLSKRIDLKKAGEWAIVTGPSEGIGRAFAELLAKEGLNTFLIGLANSGLEEVASELEKRYNIETRIFIADLIKVNSPIISNRLIGELCRRTFPMINCGQKLRSFPLFPAL